MAEETEKLKKSKYQALTHTHTHYFVPVSVETSGACGSEALSLFHDIASRVTSTTKDTFTLSQLLQQVSLAILRGNSAAVLGSSPTPCFDSFDFKQFMRLSVVAIQRGNAAVVMSTLSRAIEH